MGLIKEYCCCAIPLLNAGIYITLTEQFVVSVTAGILALVTPSSMSACLAFETCFEDMFLFHYSCWGICARLCAPRFCYSLLCSSRYSDFWIFGSIQGAYLAITNLVEASNLYSHQESTIIFRRYTTLHSMILLAVFIFSAVFIGISASKHDAAAAKCVKTFFPVDPRYTLL